MQNNLQLTLDFRLIRRMTLRTFFLTTTFSALGLTMALGQATAAPTRALVCFGSYSTPDKESVHLFQLNLKDGSLKKLSAVDGLKNPSFLKIHPNGKFLYTVNEVATFDGKRSGGVTAFALNVQAGKLTQLNSSRPATPARAISPSMPPASTCSWPTMAEAAPRCCRSKKTAPLAR